MSVHVGQTWLDRRIGRESHQYRRVIEVTAVNERHVHGWYQTWRGSEWVDEAWPGVRRKTRVLVSRFVQDYELLREAK